MNYEQGPRLFLYQEYKANISCPNRMEVQHVFHQPSLPPPSLGAPPPPHQPLVTARERQTSSPTTQPLSLDPAKIAETSTRLVYTSLINACSNFSRSKFLPGKFHSAFLLVFYYWVRGHLCTLGSSLPPSCVSPGLNSGHQAWMPSTFTQKSSCCSQPFSF